MSLFDCVRVFVDALYDGGSTNMLDEDTDLDWCPEHGYDHSHVDNLYHADECPAYAIKIDAFASDRT
jgi:hypothetical protein